MGVAWLFVLAPLLGTAVAGEPTRKTSEALDTRPTLTEWIDSSLSGVSAQHAATAGSAATTGTNPHKHLEKDYACYKMASTCGGEYPYTFWSGLSCCPANDKDESLFDNLAGANDLVGRCFMSRGYALYNNPYNLVMGENFLATCFLNQAADSCGGPSGCGEIVVSAQGPTFLPLKVITEGDPGLPADGCADSPRQSSPGQQGATPSPANSTTGSTSGARSLLQGPNQVWQTEAYLFTGPMTVTSRKYETKWERGWFQLIVPNQGNSPQGWVDLAVIEAQEAAQGWKFPRVPLGEFYTYRLEFFRKEQPQY